MSLNLGNSLTLTKTNKYQRLRDSVDESYLCEWVFLGPWDIDKGGTRFYCVLRSYRIDPFAPER